MIYDVKKQQQFLPSQLGKLKNESEQPSHLSPITCSLQKQCPESTSQKSSLAPCELHPQPRIDCLYLAFIS